MLLVMSFLQVKIRVVGGVIDQICHHGIFSNVLPTLCFSSDCRGIKTTPIMRKHSSGLPRRPVYINKGYRLNGVGKWQNLLRLKLLLSRQFPHYTCVSWIYCERLTYPRYGNLIRNLYVNDELESSMLIDCHTTRAIKKAITDLYDSREIVMAKLRAINKKRIILKKVGNLKDVRKRDI